MKKYKKRIKLKRPARELLVKILITLVILVADVIIYHLLGVYGHLAVQNNWVSAIIMVGWFWLLGGQFMWLYIIWEQ